MLGFDPFHSQFVLGDCRFGLGTSVEAVLVRLPHATRAEAPEKDRTFLKAADGDLNISLLFENDRLANGWFWMRLPDEAASWDGYEADERRRRTAHLRLLDHLFGAERFEGENLVVEPMRDPKSGLEIIAFGPPACAAERAIGAAVAWTSSCSGRVDPKSRAPSPSPIEAAASVAVDRWGDRPQDDA